MCKGWFHHPNTHWLMVHLWQNDSQAGKAVIDQQEGTEWGSFRGWPGRSVLFVGPLLKAHLLTTSRWLVVVLPTAAVRPPGGGSTGAVLPCSVYTSRRQRRLVHRTQLRRCTGGLGAIGHQQAAPGIYWCIACYYYQHPKTKIEYYLYWCYTLLVAS